MGLGECEIRAWELSSGRRKGYPTTWIYPVFLAILGCIICPRKTRKAFKKGLGKRNSFIISNSTGIFKLTKEQIVELMVNEIAGWLDGSKSARG